MQIYAARLGACSGPPEVRAARSGPVSGQPMGAKAGVHLLPGPYAGPRAPRAVHHLLHHHLQVSPPLAYSFFWASSRSLCSKFGHWFR